MRMTNRALCIGINDYPGINSDLAGCVNDAEDWAEVLRNRNFEAGDMEVLLDDEATKVKILSAMKKIVKDTKPGEIGVITYSGHGTWVPDDDGDEADGRDEALCPHDLSTVGPILDDDLYEVFVQQQPGAQIIFISDSCHSGSVAREAPALGDTLSLKGAKGGFVPRSRFLPPEAFLDENKAEDKRKLRRARLVEATPIRGIARNTALLLAGCKDTEYSYDASFDGRPNGAFTRVAIDALETLENKSNYRAWMKEIRRRLPAANYPQTPQLTGTRAQKEWVVFA
jgi:hypothetical protein